MLLRIKVVAGSAEILSDKGGQVLVTGQVFEVETKYISLADIVAVGPGGVTADPGTPLTTERDLLARRDLNLHPDLERLPGGALRGNRLGQSMVEGAAGARTPESNQLLPEEQRRVGPESDMGTARTQGQEGQDEQPAPEGDPNFGGASLSDDSQFGGGEQPADQTEEEQRSARSSRKRR